MKIAVMGVAGRMGRELVRAVHATPGCVLAAGAERPGSPFVGEDPGVLAGIGETGLRVSDDAVEIFARCDAVLDFTAPAATVAFAALAANARIVHVIGTTGFAPADEEAIKAAARHATIIKSGNMSLGINLLEALTARIAAALDPGYDIEIVEMHHRHKVDAPSGTALMLGAAAAQGRGISFSSHSTLARTGHTGPRTAGSIGFAVLRGGDVVGEHTVIFAGDGERIEIAHRATSRAIFARGAVTAALWGRGREPGLYSMRDVLGV